MQETQVQSLDREDPWEIRLGISGKWRYWLPTSVFLLREFHGQMSLVGCSPWDHKESNMTRQLTHTQSVYVNGTFSFHPTLSFPDPSIRKSVLYV